MAEIPPRGIPGDEVPERGQQQHGLRLDLAPGDAPLRIPVAEAQGHALHVGRLSPQQDVSALGPMDAALVPVPKLALDPMLFEVEAVVWLE
jgi:hypothetical protein